MLFRFNLLVTALLAVFVMGLVGCDQPADVLTPVSSSEISLDEQRLPTNPDGTVYELWVANADDTVSLGKFGYNFDTKTYLNPNSTTERTTENRFYLQGNTGVSNDVSDYDAIFISVENNVDSAPDSPANMMLKSFLGQTTVDMIFPTSDDSLWNATVRYNMRATSSGADAVANGSGIWFATYVSDDRSLDDTTDLISWEIETSQKEVTEVIHVTSVIGIDTNTIVVKDTTIKLGLDEFTQQVVRFDVITRHDSINYFPTILRLEYETSERTVFYDEFSQDDFGLPDLSPYGFQYKGWVVSPHIDPAAVGQMTKPAWSIMGTELDHTDGGILTTGNFNDITAADLSNPYLDYGFSDPPRIPDFPGEDFINNLPAPLSGPLNLVPFTPTYNGQVYVAVEPIDYTANTNFPLIAFLGPLPSFRSDVDSSTVQFTLRGWMQNNDPYRGFPKIRVSINKF